MHTTTASRDDNGDALELSDQYLHASGNYLSEQEQGLLEGWKLNKDTEFAQRPQHGSAHERQGIAIIVSICLAIALALGGGIVWLSRTARETTEAAYAVRTNDYVLDQQWDSQAVPQRREFSWVVRDQVHNPDGVFRPMILVNNQFPGPLIEANELDTIVVHVDNRAVNATAIHWHGIYQNGTPHMDGTVGITQCPIPPGGKHTYEFTVSNQSGTYWWHAHQGVQSSDGMHGPLVVHGRNEDVIQDVEYTSDRVILVSDYYHDLSSALLWQYLKPDQENVESVPDGALINGQGVRNCDEVPTRKCDNSSSHVGVPTLQLTPQQSHRLRFINVGAFAEFQLQVDEHELTVVEVDGTAVVPINFHRISISPAQRYSVVLQTDKNPAQTYWLRAEMITTCFKQKSETLQPQALAVVDYGNQSATMPNSKDWQEQAQQDCKDLDTTNLIPAEVVSAPEKEDAFFYLRANFEIGAYRLSRGKFNSSSWRPDLRSPTLYRSIDSSAALNKSSNLPSSLEPGQAYVNDITFDRSHELVIQTTGIMTIDILVSNFDDGTHPLHLHGYKYFVLAQGHGYPPLTEVGAEINRATLQPLYDDFDLSNPLRRDTASVEGFGWILLRLVADNPGAWAFHCHVSWHTEAGLLMQFLTRSDELAKFHIPQDHLQLCSADGIERGKGPDDDDYRDLAQ